MSVAEAVRPEPEEDSVEKEDELPLDEVPPARPVSWTLQIAKVERSIFDLHRSWRQGVLRLDPDFHRGFVWDLHRKVLLVESVLARIPLPVIYLSEENEDETLVIDGQQRLITLFDFVEGNLILQGLTLLPELNGMRFADLEGRLQRRFESTPLTCFILQPGTDAHIKFQIFERLNGGAVALNAQEIRNSLFLGPGLNFIKHLAADTSPGSFRDVTGVPWADKRMRVDELVLRALAFLDLGTEAYTGEMRGFLNIELQRLNRSPEVHAGLASRLLHALGRARLVFGQNAFRRYNPTNGTWTSQLSAPLLEVILTGFDRYFPEGNPLSQTTASEILQRFQRLCGEATFRASITSATQSRSAVRTRFNAWMKEISDVT